MADDIPSYRIDTNKRGFEDIFDATRSRVVIHLGRTIAKVKKPHASL